jgi:hypothetical protein
MLINLAEVELQDHGAKTVFSVLKNGRWCSNVKDVVRTIIAGVEISDVGIGLLNYSSCIIILNRKFKFIILIEL